MPAETTRRLAHVSGAAAAAAIQLLLTLPELVLLAAGFSLFLAVTAVSGRLRSIHGVGRRTLGAPLLPAGLLLAALLGGVWRHPAASAFGMLVLAFADPAAGLAGTRLRGFSWRVLGGRKSLSGSMAFLAAAFDLGLVFSFGVGTVRCAVAFGVAAALTVVEACAGFGLDNLLVPVAGTLAGRAWLDL